MVLKNSSTFNVKNYGATEAKYHDKMGQIYFLHTSLLECSLEHFR